MRRVSLSARSIGDEVCREMIRPKGDRPANPVISSVHSLDQAGAAVIDIPRGQGSRRLMLARASIVAYRDDHGSRELVMRCAIRGQLELDLSACWRVQGEVRGRCENPTWNGQAVITGPNRAAPGTDRALGAVALRRRTDRDLVIDAARSPGERRSELGCGR